MHRKTLRKATLPVLLVGVLALMGCDPADPLEEPGSYDVYVRAYVMPNPEEPDNGLSGRVYAPSADGGSSIAPGPFPLVVLMPGYGANYNQYSLYSEHLASHGAVVIGFNLITGLGLDAHHDYMARQATYVIDFALDGGGPLAGVVDAGKIGTAGHSLGGKIAFYAAAIDPRIGAVMTMDPSNSGGPPCLVDPDQCNAYPVAPNIATGAIGELDGVNAASFIMRAAPDALLNPDEQANARYFFEGLDGAGLHGVKSPALYFDMGGVSHASWLTTASIKRVTKRTMAAWLKAYFDGEDMEAYFTGDVVQGDVDVGIIKDIQTR